MRALLGLTSIVVVAIVIAMVSTSRGDDEPAIEPSFPIDDTTEPITGTAVMPFKGSETPARDPFTPYSAPDPIPYEELTADEKAVADRGLDEDQSKIQDAYASAAEEMAVRAKAEAAARQLGVENLDQVGVVGDDTEQGGTP